MFSKNDGEIKKRCPHCEKIISEQEIKNSQGQEICPFCKKEMVTDDRVILTL